MRRQTLGTAALSALVLLTVQPLSSQEGSSAQVERAQKSGQRASRMTDGAREDHHL